MHKHKFGYLAVAALAILAVGAGESRADIIRSGVFLSDHCTGLCLTGQTNGGTVTVTDHENGTLDFDIELANGNTFVGTGLDASFAFNLAGNPTITYSNLVEQAGTPAHFVLPAGNTQNAGDLHVDGTGDFEYGLDVAPNGQTPLAAGTFLRFSITGSGLDIGDLAELSTGPNGGQIMAADIYSGTTGNTGAVDISVALTPTQQQFDVPEPGSLLLMGTGLIALGGVVWFRRRRQGEPQGLAA